MSRSARARRREAGRAKSRRSGQQAGPIGGLPPALLIEHARLREPVVVEVDRPQAFRPRLVGFWRGTVFHIVKKVVATRLEHDAIYYRLLTDRGAFDLRNIRRMDPLTLRIHRAWELCAELDTIPLAPRP